MQCIWQSVTHTYTHSIGFIRHSFIQQYILKRLLTDSLHVATLISAKSMEGIAKFKAHIITSCHSTACRVESEG